MFESIIQIKPDNPEWVTVICKGYTKKKLEDIIISSSKPQNAVETNDFAEYEVETANEIIDAEYFSVFSAEESFIKILKRNPQNEWVLFAYILGSVVNRLSSMVRNGRVVDIDANILTEEEHLKYQDVTFQQDISLQDNEELAQVLQQKGIQNIETVTKQSNANQEMYLKISLKDKKTLLVLPKTVENIDSGRNSRAIDVSETNN